MDKVDFIYETYIAAAPERIWDAIINPEMTQKYWQHVNVSDWKPGSRWEHRRDRKEGELDIVGNVVEITPPSWLLITWAFARDEKLDQKHSMVSFEIEKYHGVVRLRVSHESLEPNSEMLEGITDGWPKVLSSLKSLLETGKPLPQLW